MSISKEDEVKGRSHGRKKITIEHIQDKAKKQVTFSKRRKGIFNKASELCAQCNAQVAVFTFSGAGKVFSFGHPSCDDIVKRYIRGQVATAEADTLGCNKELFWCDKSVDGLGLEELETYKASLEELRNNVASEIGNRKKKNDDNKVDASMKNRKYLDFDLNMTYDPMLDDGSST